MANGFDPTLPLSNIQNDRCFLPFKVILCSPYFQVSSGSLANLTCIVRGAPATPSRVFWYKDGAVLGLVGQNVINPCHFALIRYYSDRGTSVVRTMRPNLVASSLLIPNFSLADQVIIPSLKLCSSEYLCLPSFFCRASMFALRS